jgi:sodium/bile acid cotransporter 7
MQRLAKIVDPFIVFLVATVALASLLPVRGQGTAIAGYATNAAIALLFFLHGAKLSRQAVIAGIGHWRLHLTVFASTFALFPLLGVLVRFAASPWIDQTILTGIVFLCLLPSTVQSSIAFTAMAGGTVPAAICSATLSNLLGIVITPLLVSLTLGASGGALHGGAGGAIRNIALQLLAPFVVGHLCRPLLVNLLARHKRLVGIVDRGSILLVVYTAFSAAVVEGIWGKLSSADLAAVLVLDAIILALVVVATTVGGRLLGFSREDRIAIVFCGSKKSLISGVPMAGVLFPPAVAGPILLPLMLFHQMQLMLCALLARRYALEGERMAREDLGY